MEKLKRVFNYIFSGYPFKKDSFNYDEYWGQFSESGDYSISPFKLKLFESLISEGSSVLDIGCGNGMLLDHLKKTRHIQDSGIEISGKAVEMARQKGINAVQGDINSSDFKLDRTYDYIIISEVLEHLPKPEDVLEKLKGKFTNNLIITIPNTGFLGERLRLSFGHFPRQWVFHPSEHLRFWTVSDFLFWAAQLGFKVEKYFGLLDEYYDIKIPTWKYCPKLFARYVLYVIKETK